MTWCILSNIYFACGFDAFEHLDLIPYSLSIRSFLKAWPRNLFPQSYMIIAGRGYLHNQVCSTMFSIVEACFTLYRTISNQSVSRYITVNAFSIRGSSWPSILILYGPIISTDNLSHGMASASLADILPYLRFCFLFFWQVLQTLMWVSISSLKWGH